jgi:hypothetical protein
VDEDEYRVALQPWVEMMVGQWLEIHDHLNERPGWQFESNDGQSLWRFGEAGEARIVVVPVDTDFRIYIDEEDIDRRFMTIESLVVALEEYEKTYAGLSPSGQALLDWRVETLIEDSRPEDTD